MSRRPDTSGTRRPCSPEGNEEPRDWHSLAVPGHPGRGLLDLVRSGSAAGRQVEQGAWPLVHLNMTKGEPVPSVSGPTPVVNVNSDDFGGYTVASSNCP